MNSSKRRQHLGQGKAGSKPHSVKTARLHSSTNIKNVSGLLNRDISHRMYRSSYRKKVSNLVIECYKTDVKIYINTGFKNPARGHRGKRDNIYQLSSKSVRNLMFFLRNVMHLMHSISTVTYPDVFPSDGRVIKRHADMLGKRLARKGIRYVWVMEFQERGAGHFHIFTDKPVDRQWLALAWYEIVGSGDPNHLKAGTSVQYIVDNDDPRLESDRARYKAQKAKKNRNAKRNYISRDEAISYMVAYYKKESQKDIPFGFYKPGRFWSASRGLLQCSKKFAEGNINDLKRGLRLLLRWYKAHLRSLPKPIKWKPKSDRTRFIIWDGMRFFDCLDTLQHGETSLKLEDVVTEKKKKNNRLEDYHEPL
jgi:hypothetical protein